MQPAMFPSILFDARRHKGGYSGCSQWCMQGGMHAFDDASIVVDQKNWSRITPFLEFGHGGIHTFAEAKVFSIFRPYYSGGFGEFFLKCAKRSAVIR